MKDTKIRTARFLMVGVALIVISVVVVGVGALTGYGLPFHSSFKRIQVGMSEVQVVAALGVADERSPEFRLGQYGGFEKEYARAAESGSSYYLLWNKGIDVVYTIGFDKAGRVTIKAVGGT